MRRFLSALVCFLVLPLAALADPTIPPGSYEVEYIDAYLGPVEGVADVASDGAATVILKDPRTGRIHHLSSQDATSRDGTVELVLTGESPPNQPWTINDLTGQPLTVDQQQLSGEFALESGAGDTVSFKVSPRDPPQGGSLTLRLLETRNGTLSWIWQTRAEAATGLAPDGHGRVGTLRELKDGSFVQEGIEVWTSPATEIHGAFDAADVEDLNSPYYFLEEGDRGTPIATRYIFVFGPSLPKRWGQIELRVPASKGITYGPFGLKSELEAGATSPHAGQNFLALWAKRSRAILAAQLGSEEAAEAYDWMILKAEIDPGVAPGPQTLKVNGFSVRWVLRYADAFPKTEIVRKLTEDADGAEFEVTSEVFRPERVFIRLQTEIELPQDSLSVSVSRNGELVSFGGEPVLIAQRSASNPKLYLTPPIDLLKSPRPATQTSTGRALIVASGDVLHAGIVDEALSGARAPIARAKVYANPAQAFSPPPAEWGTLWVARPRIWEAAIERAALCHNITEQPEGGWATLAKASREDFERLVLISTDPKRQISVTLGDHAAMLLLKRQFIEDMRRQYASIAEALASRETLLASRAAFVEAYAEERHATQSAQNAAAKYRAARFVLGDYEVAAPGGGTLPYREFIRYHRLEAIASHLGIAREQAATIVANATTSVLQSYQQAIAHSIDSAEGTDECSASDLVELTGFGFDNVAAALQTRLMRKAGPDAINPGSWEPDRVARAWTTGLYSFAEAVRAQDTLADIDTQMALVVATGAATGGALAFEFAAARSASAFILGGRVGFSAAALGLDIADMTYSGIQDVSQKFKTSAERKFALGASAVLGGARYTDAVTADPSWAETMASLGFSTVVGSLGAVGGWMDVRYTQSTWRNGGRMEAIERGRRLATDFLRDSTEGLTPAQKTDLATYIDDAAIARQRGGHGALTRVQSSVLKKIDELQTSRPPTGPLPADLPAWAVGLSPQAYEDINALRKGANGEILPRDDLFDLAADDPTRLSRLLEGEDRAVALAFLKFNACRTVDWLEQGIAATKARVHDPIVGVYEAADIEKLEMEMARQGWFFSNTRHYNPVTGELTLKPSAAYFQPDEIQANAVFERIYNQTTQTLTLVDAKRLAVPAWVTFPEGHRLTARGTPVNAQLNLMAMWEAGIGFAGGGKPLKRVRMPMINNRRALAQLHWLREVFGSEIPQQALRQIHSVQYAETMLRQAGYIITRVKISPRLTGVGFDSLYEVLVKDFIDMGADEAIAAVRAEEVLIQHFGTEWRERTDNLSYGFTVTLQVEPDPFLTPRPGKAIVNEPPVKKAPDAPGNPDPDDFDPTGDFPDAPPPNSPLRPTIEPPHDGPDAPTRPLPGPETVTSPMHQTGLSPDGGQGARVEKMLEEMAGRPAYRNLISRINNAAQSGAQGSDRLSRRLKSIASMRLQTGKVDRLKTENAFAMTYKTIQVIPVIVAGGGKVDDGLLLDLMMDFHIRVSPERSLAELLAHAFTNHGVTISADKLAAATGESLDKVHEILAAARKTHLGK